MLGAKLQLDTPRKRWSEYSAEERLTVIGLLRNFRAGALVSVLSGIPASVINECGEEEAREIALAGSQQIENIIDAALERLGEPVE